MSSLQDPLGFFSLTDRGGIIPYHHIVEQYEDVGLILFKLNLLTNRETTWYLEVPNEAVEMLMG